MNCVKPSPDSTLDGCTRPRQTKAADIATDIENWRGLQPSRRCRPLHGELRQKKLIGTRMWSRRAASPVLEVNAKHFTLNYNKNKQKFNVQRTKTGARPAHNLEASKNVKEITDRSKNARQFTGMTSSHSFRTFKPILNQIYINLSTFFHAPKFRPCATLFRHSH